MRLRSARSASNCLDSVSSSPTGRLFGPVVGLMVFAYFVSRFLLFVTAWAATTRDNRQLQPDPASTETSEPAPASSVQKPSVQGSSPAGGAAGGLCMVVLPYRATATSPLPATTAWISVQVLGAVLWLVVVLCLMFSDGVAYRAWYG